MRPNTYLQSMRPHVKMENARRHNTSFLSVLPLCWINISVALALHLNTSEPGGRSVGVVSFSGQVGIFVRGQPLLRGAFDP